MTGEAWNDVMNAAADATGSIAPTLYFLSYVTFILLLFTNMFIGIVCDRFNDMEVSIHWVRRHVCCAWCTDIPCLHVVAGSCRWKRRRRLTCKSSVARWNLL